PRDASHTHIGTIFHEKLPDGSLPKRTQMKFAPNTGYAFAVSDDTWHSADPVGREVTTRDSILHTYFVDAGILRVLRNRGNRSGNLRRTESRNWAPRCAGGAPSPLPPRRGPPPRRSPAPRYRGARPCG